MFEDINKHRQAVAENIQKALEIGFTDGQDLEKAHNVGDIHPNGKWVWTQLPSGKYDWRVIKKQKDAAGGTTPAPKPQKQSTPAASGATPAPNKRDAEEEAKKEVDYEIGGKVTSKNFDSFAKLVNSKKHNFYIVDTMGGRRHRGGRITSVTSDSSGNTKIRIHWMGNGENEKKEFYAKEQAAYWLNGLDFDVEKKSK